MLVNIVNLVNSRRTGEEVIVFASKLEFIKYTLPDRTYPINLAAGDALMSVLLRPVSRLEYQQKAKAEAEAEAKKRVAKGSRRSV